MGVSQPDPALKPECLPQIEGLDDLEAPESDLTMDAKSESAATKLNSPERNRLVVNASKSSPDSQTYCCPDSKVNEGFPDASTSGSKSSLETVSSPPNSLNLRGQDSDSDTERQRTTQMELHQFDDEIPVRKYVQSAVAGDGEFFATKQNWNPILQNLPVHVLPIAQQNTASSKKIPADAGRPGIK